VTSMRRVVVYPGRIAVEAADIPVPGPGEALVRTLVAGVCGSDLHAARGRHPFVTSGRENRCENLQFSGCGYAQGGTADYFTLAAGRLHPVPDTLDDQTAALIEPLPTPVHAVRLAGDVGGRAIAILGAGTIGLLTLAVLRAHSAGRVVTTDPLPAERGHSPRPPRLSGPRRREIT
jgi:threonine dehydrogenase-like Zn-dependent dehydrogenase